MNATSDRKLPCFECEDGFLETVVEDYTGELSNGASFSVSGVPMERCAVCGDTVIGDEGNRKIDAEIAQITGAVTPTEIQAFLDKYDLSQKEASAITGYGEKNISRWLSGKMRPSKSVSKMIRLLLADSGAFKNLKNQEQGVVASASFPAVEQQPDAAESEILKLVDYTKLETLELVEKGRSPKLRRSEICRVFRCVDLHSFKALAEERNLGMAACKDTGQQSNLVSGGLWTLLGERAASVVDVEPFDRDKLQNAVKRIREFTRKPLKSVIGEVTEELRKAGVALVFVPILKKSALRGCTRMLSPTKAMVIHGLKYQTVSQFWIVLFHELAHLLLHIKTPEDVFAEYENQAEDEKEQEAQNWAYDKLFYSDEFRVFDARHSSPKLTDLKALSCRLKVQPGILAEIYNKKKGRDIFEYRILVKAKLFEGIPKDVAQTLWSKIPSAA